ncbi:MAG: hypothetical protein JKY86_05995 [Gammaproteobacteria bacterium]|nr:hypothetical protein [Gammaproteobacteria bacterium]
MYQHLIDELRKKPIHSLIASVTLPNAFYVALHENLGYKFGEFIAVDYWQLNL